MRNRLKTRFRQNQSHSSIIKKQTVINQNIYHKNCKTCHLNGGRQKGDVTMNISDYIPFGKDNAISRKKLEKVTGLSDRDIREEIAMARRNTVILNLSNGQGYFQPIEGEEDELVIKYYKQESSRLKRIGWSLLATRKRVREIQNGS